MECWGNARDNKTQSELEVQPWWRQHYRYGYFLRLRGAKEGSWFYFRRLEDREEFGRLIEPFEAPKGEEQEEQEREEG